MGNIFKKSLKASVGCKVISDFFVLSLLLFVFNSCTKQQDQFVINEIMAVNHAGIVAQDGELYDWIEIKNISSQPASLKGYSLKVEKNGVKKSKKKQENVDDKDDPDKSENNKEKKDKKRIWDFPDVVVKPGECIIVYASKKDDDNDGKELHACFKMPSVGGKLQLLHNGDVVQEITYGELKDDQCYRRLEDGNYEASYEQSPGFENNSDGYEQFCSMIEKHRNGPLRLWEAHAKGRKEGKAWIEIKNVSDSAVNLEDYCLATGRKEMSKWTFPQVSIASGGFYVVDCKEAGFKCGGRKTIMITRDGEFLDGIIAGAAPLGTSVGRVVGKNGFFFFKEPTPSKENTTKGERVLTYGNDNDSDDEE